MCASGHGRPHRKAHHAGRVARQDRSVDRTTGSQRRGGSDNSLSFTNFTASAAIRDAAPERTFQEFVQGVEMPAPEPLGLGWLRAKASAFADAGGSQSPKLS